MVLPRVFGSRSYNRKSSHAFMRLHTLVCDRCVQVYKDGKMVPTGKLEDGSVCPICHGTGLNVVDESAGDAINDWSSRNFWLIITGLLIAIGAWLVWGWRTIFGPKANP